MILMLNLAEHDLAGACAERQCQSRSKPRSRAPSVLSRNGTADCSIEVGSTMSNPTTLAPPSMIAVNTSPSSRVQVTVGVPSNGGVRNVSSSSATTTAAESCGGDELRQLLQRR